VQGHASKHRSTAGLDGQSGLLEGDPGLQCHVWREAEIQGAELLGLTAWAGSFFLAHGSPAFWLPPQHPASSHGKTQLQGTALEILGRRAPEDPPACGYVPNRSYFSRSDFLCAPSFIRLLSGGRALSLWSNQVSTQQGRSEGPMDAGKNKKKRASACADCRFSIAWDAATKKQEALLGTTGRRQGTSAKGALSPATRSSLSRYSARAALPPRAIFWPSFRPHWSAESHSSAACGVAAARLVSRVSPQTRPLLLPSSSFCISQGLHARFVPHAM